ncbi:UNVERIFIED_CONTAM: hypothetical protein PYX00_005741 [Menopon gallinae]|uniref:Uncharacterized protein n=1 Tax=Menopon gallinae TaxID=328185 RepID=A0AAW2HSS3_9NEOP
MDNDYMEDSDYFHANPLRGMGSENRPRVKQRPHSYQQQIQHDRDTYGGYGHRDGYSSYSGERNKNMKRTSNRDRKGESPLEQLDPCMIHCIFQEMQMLDENGKPDKNTVSEKMSQKIRNPELKSFIQDSVEECFSCDDWNEPIKHNNKNQEQKNKNKNSKGGNNNNNNNSNNRG